MKKLYRIFTVIALMSISLITNAQSEGLSLTLLPQMPFANYTNPGIRVNYNGLVGIGISNIGTSVYNSNILSSNIFRYENGVPVAYDGVAFVNSLDELHNYVGADFSLDIINVGFRVKKLFFNIDWRMRFNSQLDYSKDFVGFFLRGNANYMDDNPADFAVSGKLTSFSEIGVTAQYDVNKHLTVGIRPKVLFGVADVSLTNERTKIYTNSDTYAMSADIDFKIQGSLACNTQNIYRISDITNILNSDLLNTVSPTKNLGFGIDLGAEYVFNEHWGAAAGVYDLGFITWKESKMKVKQSTGTILVDAFIDDIEDITGNKLDYNSVVDAMVERVWGNDSVVDGGEYKTTLNTRIQLQGYYQLNDMVRGTFIYNTQFYGSKWYHSFSAAYSGYFFKFLNLTANYTYSTLSGSSVGAGIGFHVGPFNVYAATDNILIATKAKKPTIEMLTSYSAMNVRLGIVFSIGKYQNIKSRLADESIGKEDYNEK